MLGERSNSFGAFAGVRVIDFSTDIAGPMATMLLADHGAEVIKIEPPGGEHGRALPGFWCWSRNKRAVALDLTRASDSELARRLVASADVALFDRPAAELDALELDAASCHARNPSLLHTRVGGWGAPGPWSALPSDETLLLALSGAAFGQFSYDDVPVHLTTPLMRYANGILAASAIAAALYERQHSGEGQRLTIDALHASAACLGTSTERAGSADRSRPVGSLGTGPNYKLYRCADGEWLFLATLLPHHFELALRAIGLRDEILAMEGVDGSLRNATARGVGGRVRTRLEACFAQRPRSVWLELLHAHDVPAGPCGTRERWFDSEPVRANDLRASVSHPELGPVELPGLALELSRTPGRIAHLLQPADPEALLQLRSQPAKLPVPTPREPGRGPLHGVQVLDLGTVISTPFAAAILANFGANVTKLETPSGDGYRNGPGYLAYNRDKRSIALDLKAPACQRWLEQLVRRSDVVCDNFRSGVLTRLGLHPARLADLNPRAISASVTAFGERGPLRERPGFDPLLQAISGLMLAQGGDDEPVFHHIPINDVASAMMLSFGITAALFARERTGRGQRVGTSLAAQSCLMQSGELTFYRGRPPAPIGRRDCPGLSPVRRFYPCADGDWIAIACSTRAQVEALYLALGAEGCARACAPDAALEQPVDAALSAVIAAHLASEPCAHWLQQLGDAHVPVARAWRPHELDRSPLHIANRYFDRATRSPGQPPVHTPARYAQFSRTPAGFQGDPSTCGAHTREILRELGCDDATIDALIAAGHCTQAAD